MAPWSRPTRISVRRVRSSCSEAPVNTSFDGRLRPGLRDARISRVSRTNLNPRGKYRAGRIQAHRQGWPRRSLFWRPTHARSGRRGSRSMSVQSPQKNHWRRRIGQAWSMRPKIAAISARAGGDRVQSRRHRHPCQYNFPEGLGDPPVAN